MDHLAVIGQRTGQGRKHVCKVHAGLMVKKTDSEVVLKDARNVVVRVPTDQIDSLDKQAKSLMPDNLLSDLTAQEAADLLEYLASLPAEE